MRTVLPVPARLREVSADWLPSVVLAGVSAHELAYNHAGLGYWLLAQGLVWSLVVRRRAPEIVLAATLVLAGACWVTGTLLVANLGVFVALHAVARHAPRARAVVAVVAVEVAAVVAAVQFSPMGSVNDGVVLLTGVTVATYFLGTGQRTVQDSLAALKVRTAELERERELNAEMAAAAERTRIAREVHDVVAHSVSVMIALSEGAAATADDDEARGSMRQVASTGRLALTELRGVLAILQPKEDVERSPTPSVASLEALVQDLRDAGLDVHLSVTGDVNSVSAGLQTTLYRLVQESLTNTLKHAPAATKSSVAVDVIHGGVTVVVADDGGTAAADTAPGHGLRGMRQRVEAYGGQITTGHDGSRGWVVTATVPREGGCPA